MALSGPGAERDLAPGALLVALSPDGRRAVVSETGGFARLLDVASGAELSRIPLGVPVDPGGPALQYLAYAGSWVGDRVVAESGAGLAVLGVVGSELSVESVLELPSGAFPMSVNEPQFVDEDATRVVAWAPIEGEGADGSERLYAYVDCDLERASCVHGPLRSDDVFYQPYNPSRPARRGG